MDIQDLVRKDDIPSGLVNLGRSTKNRKFYFLKIINKYIFSMLL
jgi:hypothetical protein